MDKIRSRRAGQFPLSDKISIYMRTAFQTRLLPYQISIAKKFRENGRNTAKYLNPDAYPTIHLKPVKFPSSNSTPVTKKSGLTQCPKIWKYLGLLLAGLHFNENMQRSQARTKDGVRRYCIVFPKAKAGNYSLKEIKVPCTYGYVQMLKEEVDRIARKEGDLLVQLPHVPLPLSSSYYHPDKSEVVNNFQSRFKVF